MADEAKKEGTNESGEQKREPGQRFSGMTAKEVMEFLFSKTKLETGSDGKYPVGQDTKGLLALFSDGTFLVSNTHKYDGRVLSFQSIVRKKGGRIEAPEYVAISLLSQIYNFNAKEAQGKNKKVDLDEDVSNRMQKEFVDIIYRAAEQKVSDIHVVVSDNSSVMFRIAGSMKIVLEYSKDWGEAFVRSVFAAADISDSNYAQNEFQVGQKLGNTPLRGGEQNLYLPENVLAIRLQFNPVAFGSRYLIMRVLYANSDSKNDDDLGVLGFSEYETSRLYRMRAFPTGLSYIAGPTGSGKSTTLQRNMIKMLKEANYEINLITVEDPPEYPIPGARQLPVTNATTEQEKDAFFTQALSAALRSDPDTMMVGETRTLAAADLVFKGALSGHNMWSTLHANSAPAIISRLFDMGVAEFKLRDPELLRGLLSQRLFKKLCPKCRVPIKTLPDNPVYARLEVALGKYGIEQSCVQGPGCQFCNGKGIIGRIVASEIVMTDSKFLELFMDQKKTEAIDYWLNNLRGRTLKEDAIGKMLAGTISVNEVERWCGMLDLDAVY
ncbi:MAG: Flp pilus assembly complex ATPase component TadA [Alphaproteobacteria bacterium]|nr:Flp pilus assembly complex ATPase component TadA [Alphaproteobacteria bacterium]